MVDNSLIQQFREEGYCVARGLFSPDEAKAYWAASHALIERLSATRHLDATWGSARAAVAEAAKTQIYHCHDVQFYDAAFARLIVDPKFTEIAAACIGGDNVQLHHTKLFIKPPERGSPFPMHQDAPYFPHDRHTMMAAIVHFDDAPEEKGCLRVVPRSHKLGILEHSSEGGWHLPFDQYPIESATLVPAKAGDVLFFNYLTIHGSGVNVSSEARTTLLVQMRDPSDPPTIKTHESRGQGMMLRGVNPEPDRA